MTIRTLALASAATSLQDHRLALGAFMAPGASVLERRAGLYYYPGAANLAGVSALQASVSPFLAVVDGTSNALQGQVVVVVDAAETLTFSAGEPSVARTDRVVLQVRDNTYDASGFTDARVVVVKGNTSTGAANAVPASSLLLWEVVVPIGASSITFASARVDKRQWTATPLRIPVNSSSERDALPAIAGMEVTRLDTGDVEQYWSSSWRAVSFGSATQPRVRITNGSAQALTSFSDTTLTFSSARYNTNSMWSAGAPTRITIPSGMGGIYHIGSSVGLSGSSGQYVGASIRLNGSTVIAKQELQSSSTCTINLTGDWEASAGDYFELIARVNTSGFTTRTNPGDTPEFWAHRVSA
ncbi:hypothetical protein [Planobispora rosea]|uniref:hypothetical protein n=1 Tax=Planobispora rosea TaxID=35762 RepID=UPI00114CE041|nr:hypothetical protein [Planobispora rosea]